MIDNSSGTATDSEMATIDIFNEKLQLNNYWVMAAGIGSSSTALLIDNRNGLNEVSAKSLLDSPDFYSGFWIIDVPDNGLATSLALEASKACNRRVELRPFLN